MGVLAVPLGSLLFETVIGRRVFYYQAHALFVSSFDTMIKLSFDFLSKLMPNVKLLFVEGPGALSSNIISQLKHIEVNSGSLI